MSAPFQLRPEVQKLATTLVDTPDGVAFADEALVRIGLEVTRLPIEQRIIAAEHLALLGAQLEQVSGHKAELAMAQLMVVVKDLVRSIRQDNDGFVKAPTVASTDSRPALPQSGSLEDLWK